MQLTSKEVMYLEDHIKMESLMSKYLGQCSAQCSDAELKKMCGDLSQLHHNNHMALSKHVQSAAMH